ncbi:hypothetical protein [Nocardia testacea]|uniref:hypothetical protein n=1 Tax=Nocardia testacea TaxID=248551 RepID=UPI003406FC09
MMSRIPWTRYGGDDVEAFAAMCVCRQRPKARRIRPSIGDRGIDIYVPLGDNRVAIYQVKKYAENLKSDQLTKITNSYTKVKKYADERGWTIAEWHLALPLDPTPGNDEWFEKLTAGDSFEAIWEGLDTFDNWAADYPQVVDYYLEGGKNRLLEEQRRFASFTSILLPGIDPEAARREYSILEPARVLDRLALLNTTLNDADPHYQYVISTGPRGTVPYTSGDYPALVASMSQAVEGSVVTVHILARCAESLAERPITHKGKVVVEKGSEEELEWQKFLDYGRIPSKPLKVRDLVISLPGGLGGANDEGLLFIREVPDQREGYIRSLAIVDPVGSILAEVEINFGPPRVNHDSTGVSSKGTDKSGILTVEVLSKTVGEAWDITINFTLDDVTDHAAADIAPALALANHCFAPNSLRISDPRIPRRRHDSLLTVDRPRNQEARFAEQRFRYVQALAEIQKYADFLIKVPDLATVTADQAAEIIRVGRLLNGETVVVGWDELTVTLHSHVTTPTGLSALVADTSLEVSLGASIILLGRQRAVVEVAEVKSSETSPDGVTTVKFQPALGKNTAQLMWAGPASVDPEFELDSDDSTPLE